MEQIIQKKGNLRVSTSVIQKIAHESAKEIAGVVAVSVGNAGVRGVFSKTNIQNPVGVTMAQGLAEITVSMVVKFGSHIPKLCEAVQQRVKSNVQTMTGIPVFKVNIIVTGVAQEPQDA